MYLSVLCLTWGIHFMKVPFIDLKAQYESIKDEVNDAIQQVLYSCSFAGGQFVEQFERQFAEFCHTDFAIGVGSGTEALWLVLLALGIDQGDEVITTPNSFIATAEVISFCKAKPIFVDINEKTYTMNPALLEPAISPKTKAIIPVHLFGHMADMDPIMDVARRYNLFVIEDACQAQGAKYKDRFAGAIGDAGCFSFYPGKNLGAYGEAGAVTTNNAELAEKIKALRDHGQIKKYHHRLIGWNSRMDGIQAAILSVKLKHLDDWNNKRRKIAGHYNKKLASADGLIKPSEAPFARHVYHIYAIRTIDRDKLLAHLAAKEIYCGIHYPKPIHLQEAYSFLGLPRESFPKTEICADELLSLPMFPELTTEQIDYTAFEIKQSLS